jgi:hypothetical protein
MPNEIWSENRLGQGYGTQLCYSVFHQFSQVKFDDSG